MKKILVTICLIASVYVSSAQILALPKENINIIMAARKVLVEKTKLPLETITRTMYVLESLELKKVTAIKTFSDKPAELAKALAAINASKLNNIKGIIPADVFATLSKEDIALLTK